MKRILVAIVVAMALVAASCAQEEPTAAVSDDSALVGRPILDDALIGSSVAGVTLPDVSNGGVPFAMVAPEGEVLIMYFGFVSCPDVCPTTLWDVKKALEQVGDDDERVTVAMATVDPGRDTDSIIHGYLTSFIDDGHALRTEDTDALQAAGDAFGAHFTVITSVGGDIEVEHTAYLYAVDDKGVIRKVWVFGTEPEAIAADLSEILAGTG